MKTLVIHPKDESTAFLDIVYKDVPNKTVITDGITKMDLKKLMKEYDRYMMMGHGSPGGLFSVGQFPLSGGYIIDELMVPELRKKDNSIFIWCNADKFVDSYSLRGFYSGMFISEVGEASWCGLPGTSQDIVDESNFGFCNIISKYINETCDVIHNNVKNEYGLIAENNPVAEYNNRRLYVCL